MFDNHMTVDTDALARALARLASGQAMAEAMKEVPVSIRGASDTHWIRPSTVVRMERPKAGYSGEAPKVVLLLIDGSYLRFCGDADEVATALWPQK